MSRDQESSKLLAVVVLLAAAGAAAFFFLGRAATDVAPQAVVSVEPGDPLPTRAPGPEDEMVEPARRPEGAPTSVVWPLEVDCSFLSSDAFERAEGMLAVGSGASASLVGSIYSATGKPEEGATVTFLAGANQGRVLVCDSTGAYGASDLYGGLSILSIETPSGSVAEREVRLRELTEARVSVGFGSPGAVYGKVKDREGNPIEGAQVRIDGKESLTDHEGIFHVPYVASGSALTIVEKEGYALYREILPVTHDFVLTPDKVTFVLHPAARLSLSVAENIGAREPALVYLLPGGGQRVNDVMGQRTFPWHRINPVEVFPGGTTVVDGLPAGRVDIFLFHSGGTASPPQSSVRLAAGQERAEVLHLAPTGQIHGRVVRDGVGVAGAQVRLEAPNRTAATLTAIGRTSTVLQSAVLPHLPPALQEVQADSKGRFVFTAYPGTKGYYLSATSPDGKWSGTDVVRPDVENLELSLSPIAAEQGDLVLSMKGRYQGLPVKLRVRGTPRDLFELSAEEDLLVAGLERGTWRVRVLWNGDELERGALVKIGAEPASLELGLPEGAVHGQTEFERTRSGY